MQGGRCRRREFWGNNQKLSRRCLLDTLVQAIRKSGAQGSGLRVSSCSGRSCLTRWGRDSSKGRDSVPSPQTEEKFSDHGTT